MGSYHSEKIAHPFDDGPENTLNPVCRHLSKSEIISRVILPFVKSELSKLKAEVCEIERRNLQFEVGSPIGKTETNWGTQKQEAVSLGT